MPWPSFRQMVSRVFAGWRSEGSFRMLHASALRDDEPAKSMRLPGHVYITGIQSKEPPSSGRPSAMPTRASNASSSANEELEVDEFCRLIMG